MLFVMGITAFVLMRNSQKQNAYHTGNILQAEIANDTVKGTLWEPMEWPVTNPDYSGNPFDIISVVTFLHKNSGKIIRTEMFYDGDDTWKFRFTPVKTGIWEFSSNSETLGLNGVKGTIKVTENPDSTAYGFLTHIGNKYALQAGEDSYKGFLLNIYMNKTKPEYSFREGNEADFTGYAREAKNNGCTAIYTQVVANSWFKFPTLSYDEHNSKNPDPETFRAIEKMLHAARKEKVHLHIWAWGDESRKQTPIGVGEGINGQEDRRLMRYIAARLGPLPGWSMGYGFDLHEWVANKGPDKVRTWAGFLSSHFGWQHLLSARGQNLLLPNGINSYDGFGRNNVELFTTPYGPQNFAEVFEDMKSDTNHVQLYEERHTYNRQDDPSYGTNGEWNLDMNKTRRLMWWETMSGGMGGWFGFYETWSPAYGGHPYPAPEQLRTHRKFWTEKSRFLIDFFPDTNFTSGYGLRTEDFRNIVVYQENTDSIKINLLGMTGQQKAIAVDTKKEYQEIDAGSINPSVYVWHAPYKSDWAIAIGSFDNPYYHKQDSSISTNDIELHSFTAEYSDEIVMLKWVTKKELNVSGFEILKKKKRTGTWDATGIIQAEGFSLTDKEYSFFDDTKAGDSLLYYALKVIYNNNGSKIIDSLKITVNGSGSYEGVPQNYVLLQNFPNPFNAGTVIKFGLPRKTKVRLTVFNNLGEKIAILVDDVLNEGFHSFNFLPGNTSSGIYYYLLEAEYFVTAKKMIILK